MSNPRKISTFIKRFWDISFFGGITATALFSIEFIVELFGLSNSVPNFTGAIGAIIIFGILPAATGFYFRKKYKILEKEYTVALVQKAILSIAISNKGIVKVTDLALELEITYEQAKELLASSTYDGFAIPEVDENGFIYYTLPEIKSSFNP